MTVPTAGTRPAVFLDRDGTLIRDVPHLGDPRRVELLPGTGRALRRLTAAGFVTVLVTNQSAIGRGLIDETAYRAVGAALDTLLADEGCRLDASYFCPEVPRGSDRTVIEHPDRKPGPGMLLRAAADLGLDLAASWMVGDMVSDVLAGLHAGCRGAVLVGAAPAGAPPALPAGFVRTAPDVAAAADLVLASLRTDAPSPQARPGDVRTSERSRP
ncbi:D-glycero-alpha-D-manno-heptose-1,7-bisphosphate 7-phosphatase [Streptomyces sp. NPDC059467]|uniref:D-glycero-alpha-D-manno-heptose-1,7-bisphosphate 7-phosphatase n=1 Tax=Streptomyces sp. NPDC059467 TaxID=3346844 RepID=UPI0036AF9FFD